jgi:hypothetical protein
MTMAKVVAIHQPNFFPWLGYFDKLAKCDLFVFLDDVQLQKTGGGWVNRVKIAISGEPRWISCPVDRNYHGYRAINESMYSDRTNWRNSIVGTIKNGYRKAPYFRQVFPWIEQLVFSSETNVAAYNIHVIKAIATAIGIDVTKFRNSSELPHQGASNELLISLIKLVEGNTYLYGGGAESYQDPRLFEEKSIALVPQSYVPTFYQQWNVQEYVPGLSVIDCLMNIGVEGVKQLLLTQQYFDK